MTKRSTPPAWFDAAIADGLQRLYALSLPRTPSADVLYGTAAVWVDALWPTRAWDETRDTPRLQTSFVRLCSVAEQWPAPAMLLRYLPEAQRTQPALERFWTAEEMEDGRRKLREALRDTGITPSLPYEKDKRHE